ncbi:MAG: hypothetical protein IJE48_00710 [Clostridia bacterium]|nr:hypothetical protein [Clostridia bacterium]
MLFESVTIVISATDESVSLIKTVDTVMQTCSPSDIDSFLIVIPEAAGAECLEAIDLLKERYPEKVRKLIQKRPFIGGAMRDSIDSTLSSHIMFFSADIPVELGCIPVMIEKAKQAPDTIIKISRWLEKNSFHGYRKGRKLFNLIAQKFIGFLFASRLTDFTAPILISPTAVYKSIIFRELNFPCLLESVIIPVRAGCRFEEIPAKTSPRSEGKSKNSALQTILYFRTALRVRLTPLKKLYKVYFS